MREEPDGSMSMLLGKQALGALDALTQADLERRVFRPTFHVAGDRSPDHFRDRLVLDIGNRLQRFRLLFREANRHRFSAFHDHIVRQVTVVVKLHGCVVSCNHYVSRSLI